MTACPPGQAPARCPQPARAVAELDPDRSVTVASGAIWRVTSGTGGVPPMAKLRSPAAIAPWRLRYGNSRMAAAF